MARLKRPESKEGLGTMVNVEIFQDEHHTKDAPLLRKFADHVTEYSGRSLTHARYSFPTRKTQSSEQLALSKN